MASNIKTEPEIEEQEYLTPASRTASSKAAPFKATPDKAAPFTEESLPDSDLKDDYDDRPEKKGGRGKAVAIVIVLLLIGAAVAVIGFNTFGWRDKYVYGLLRNIPIVKNVIPSPESEDDDEFAGMTKDQLVLQIQGLQTQLDNKDAEINSLNDKSDSYVKELTRLKEIEAYQQTVKAQKEEFDNMIVLDDPNAYARFYESVDPANAERLYKEVVGTAQTDKELKDYVATFSAMDESEAAKILEAMISTDMNKVVLILKNINVDARAAILGKFTPANGARVARIMAPESAQ